MTLTERIDRLRRWTDATRPGATTELDREIIVELFDQIELGESALGVVDRLQTKTDSAEREPFHSLRHNPVFRPDFYELVKRGFARWIEKEGGPLELTPEGIAALDRWVQR